MAVNGPVFGRLPYDLLYGNWLNLERQHARETAVVWHGVAIAFGAKPDPGVLEALAKDRREAADLAAQARRRQKEAEAAAKHGF